MVLQEAVGYQLESVIGVATLKHQESSYFTIMDNSLLHLLTFLKIIVWELSLK